jgi:signal transduction histidine kinase
MLDKACGRLNAVLEASRDPDRTTEETVQELWNSLIGEVELKADTKVDENMVNLILKESITPKTKLRLRSLAYHDLCSILGNLLDNAARYTADAGPITVSIETRESDLASHLVFTVSDSGHGIPKEVLQEVKDTNYSETYRLPGTSGVVRGTGLRRVFGLAKINDWQVRVNVSRGTTFEVITPDYALPIRQENIDER